MPRPEASPPRVLCYSPYNAWKLHGQWEITILQGLKQRGAQLDYVLCDGLFSDCDLFWAATSPRPERACTWCQAETTRLVHDAGLDFQWLGRYLAPEENREARRWARSLSPEELATARYEGWDVAAWIESSVHSHLRRSELDVADPDVEKAYRSYLFSGLVACFALERLLDETRPDVLLQFNGRQSSTRVAFELARRRGIRVVTHERGPRSETLALHENGTCTSLKSIRDVWDDWGDVPLTASELEAIGHHLDERERGVNLSWTAFTTAPQQDAEVRAALGLEPDRPMWVLFTSSDDEVAAESEWQGSWESQLAWVRATVAYAGQNPGIDLVIRIHPNTGSRRSTGVNVKQLEQFERLRDEGLPSNVRMVAPEDEISSYTLMNMATAGLVYQSTAALELACKGKATVVAAGTHITGLPFARTADRPEGYTKILDGVRALPVGKVSQDVRRLALRMAYGLFFRVPVDFPLVRMPNPMLGQLTWTSLEELAPGKDAGLDRCSRIVLDGEPVSPPPGPAEQARSTDAEDAFLGQGSQSRRFVVLAFADELIAEPAMLAAWAERFSASDPVTLLIESPSEATDLLVEAVAASGLEGDGTADLLAVDPRVEPLPPFDAVFSRRDTRGDLAGAPRFDHTSMPSLVECLDRVLGGEPALSRAA